MRRRSRCVRKRRLWKKGGAKYAVALGFWQGSKPLLSQRAGPDGRLPQFLAAVRRSAMIPRQGVSFNRLRPQSCSVFMSPTGVWIAASRFIMRQTARRLEPRRSQSTVSSSPLRARLRPGYRLSPFEAPLGKGIRTARLPHAHVFSSSAWPTIKEPGFWSAEFTKRIKKARRAFVVFRIDLACCVFCLTGFSQGDVTFLFSAHAA
jgi:hypothetical protein